MAIWACSAPVDSQVGLQPLQSQPRGGAGGTHVDRLVAVLLELLEHPLQGGQGHRGVALVLQRLVPADVALLLDVLRRGIGVDVLGKDLEGIQHVLDHLGLHDVDAQGVKAQILLLHGEKRPGHRHRGAGHRRGGLGDAAAALHIALHCPAGEQHRVAVALAVGVDLRAGGHLLAYIAAHLHLRIDVMEGSFDAFAGALGADNANFHSQYLGFLD